MMCWKNCRDVSFHMHHPAVASRATFGLHCHVDMPSTDMAISGRKLCVASIHRAHHCLACYVSDYSEQVCHRWEADKLALCMAVSVLWAVSDLLCGVHRPHAILICDLNRCMAGIPPHTAMQRFFTCCHVYDDLLLHCLDHACSPMHFFLKVFFSVCVQSLGSVPQPPFISNAVSDTESAGSSVSGVVEAGLPNLDVHFSVVEVR
jgi:hypothetical protein